MYFLSEVLQSDLRGVGRQDVVRFVDDFCKINQAQFEDFLAVNMGKSLSVGSRIDIAQFKKEVESL